MFFQKRRLEIAPSCELTLKPASFSFVSASPSKGQPRSSLQSSLVHPRSSLVHPSRSSQPSSKPASFALKKLVYLLLACMTFMIGCLTIVSRVSLVTRGLLVYWFTGVTSVHCFSLIYSFNSRTALLVSFNSSRAVLLSGEYQFCTEVYRCSNNYLRTFLANVQSKLFQNSPRVAVLDQF